MSVASQETRGDDRRRAQLRAALETGDQVAAVEIARQDLTLVRKFANDMIKEIKPQLSLAARRAAVAAAPEEPAVHREFMRALILARKPEDAVAHAKSTPFDELARPKLFFDIAEDFLAEGRPKQAIATLEAMQQSWQPGNEARRVLLKAEMLTRCPEEAIERLDGIDLPPQERAVMLQYLAGRFEVQGNKTAALNARKAAAATVPQSFNVVLDYLTALKSMDGDSERVIKALEDEALQGADRARLLRELAGAANAATSKQLALRRVAAEFAPEDVTLVHEYVRTVLDERGFESALSALDDAAFDKADRVQVLRDMGGFLARARKQDLALRCKAEAYTRKPQEFGPAYELASFLMSLGGPEAVRAYFSQDGQTPRAIINVLARLEKHLIESDEQTVSRDCSRLILVLSPDDAANNAQRAYPTIKIRGFEDFVATMKRAALTEQQTAEIVTHLAELARKNSDGGIVVACTAVNRP
jgi:hypothetical protein